MPREVFCEKMCEKLSHFFLSSWIEYLVASHPHLYQLHYDYVILFNLVYSLLRVKCKLTRLLIDEIYPIIQKLISPTSSPLALSSFYLPYHNKNVILIDDDNTLEYNSIHDFLQKKNSNDLDFELHSAALYTGASENKERIPKR